jgi:hypothetical protein
MNETVRQIVANVINGNISDVKNALNDLQGIHAALVAVRVCNALPKQERCTFIVLLNRWAE